MITVKLIGGLGNQMFQYALGRCLSLEKKTELYLDTGNFHHDIRTYELGVFDIHPKMASKKQIPFYQVEIKNPILFRLRYPFQWICKKIDPRYVIENPNHPKVFSGMYDFQLSTFQKALSAKHNLYLEGFWQSQKYFEKYKDVIRKDFKLKSPIDDQYNLNIIKKLKNCESVSIHVRRGDYAGTHYAGICDINYYDRAIEYIKKHVKNPVFFVFTDDADWCKETFKKHQIEEFCENGGNPREKNKTISGILKHGSDAYKNMILISECKHNIMANSSFSWRGSWLNNNPDKIVIAPQKRHQNLDYKDIIPNDWIRL